MTFIRHLGLLLAAIAFTSCGQSSGAAAPGTAVAFLPTAKQALTPSPLASKQSWFYIGACDSPGGIFTFNDRGKATAPSPGFSAIGNVGGIAYDPHDRLLYVTKFSTVQAYDRQGTLQSLSGSFAGSANPISILYDPHNYRIYVGNGASGSSKSSMKVYNEQGVQQTVEKVPRYASNPQQIAFDPSTAALYVPNFEGGVKVYTEAGAKLPYTFANTEHPDGALYDPHNGWIYVANLSGTPVTVYTKKGRQLSVTGDWAGANGPAGLAFDARTNLIYVTNFNSGKVTAYDESGNQQSLTGFSGMTASDAIRAIAIVPQ